MEYLVSRQNLTFGRPQANPARVRRILERLRMKNVLRLLNLELWGGEREMSEVEREESLWRQGDSLRVLELFAGGGSRCLRPSCGAECVLHQY